MEKNQIYIKCGTNYKEMTKELLSVCGLSHQIKDRKSRIAIKPNLVSPSEASFGANHTSGNRGRHHRVFKGGRF